MTADLPPHQVWIALGSNISPETHLPEAVDALSLLGQIVNRSSVWQSCPVGDEQQPDFCNAVIQLETDLELDELRHSLRMIEQQLGRVRDPLNKNGPRTIDLDIVLFDRIVVETSQIILPDPEIERRPFLAIPLAEVSPEVRHPVTGKSFGEIASTFAGQGGLTLRNDIGFASF